MLISITNIKTFLGFTGYYQNYVDAPPSFLMDSVASSKKKTTEGEGVGMRSLARSISRVEGHVEASRLDYKIDKQIIYSHGPA